MLCKRCHADGPNVTDPEIMWDWIKAYILEDGKYVYNADFVEQIRRHAVQHLKETNGTVSVLDLISGVNNPEWQD